MGGGFRRGFLLSQPSQATKKTAPNEQSSSQSACKKSILTNEQPTTTTTSINNKKESIPVLPAATATDGAPEVANVSSSQESSKLFRKSSILLELEKTMDSLNSSSSSSPSLLQSQEEVTTAHQHPLLLLIPSTPLSIDHVDRDSTLSKSRRPPTSSCSVLMSSDGTNAMMKDDDDFDGFDDFDMIATITRRRPPPSSMTTTSSLLQLHPSVVEEKAPLVRNHVVTETKTTRTRSTEQILQSQQSHVNTKASVVVIQSSITTKTATITTTTGNIKTQNLHNAVPLIQVMEDVDVELPHQRRQDMDIKPHSHNLAFNTYQQDDATTKPNVQNQQHPHPLSTTPSSPFLVLSNPVMENVTTNHPPPAMNTSCGHDDATTNQHGGHSQPQNDDMERLARQLSLLLVKQLHKLSHQPVEQRITLIRQFIQTNVVSPAHETMVWDSLLERMITLSSHSTKDSTKQKAASQTTMVMLVSKTLLWQRVSSVVPYLIHTTNSDDKKTRILALQATFVVEAALQDVLVGATPSSTPSYTSTSTAAIEKDQHHNVNDDNTFVVIQQMLDQVLPPLTTICGCSSTQRRSVLSQQCLQVSYMMISAAVHLIALPFATVPLSLAPKPPEQEQERLQHRRRALLTSLWHATASCLLPLLQVHLSWSKPSTTTPTTRGDAAITVTHTDATASSAVKDDDIPGIVRLETARKACMAAVLQDWQECIKYFQGEVEQFVCSNDEDRMPPDAAVIRVCERWCATLAGVRVNDNLALVGSFHQTLVESHSKHQRTATITSNDILNYLQVVKEQPLEIEQRRALLRGVAAWLGQSKRHAEETNNSPKFKSEAAKLVLSTLSWSSNLACVHLASSILDMLWCDTDGLPPGICDTGDDSSFSTSVEILVDLLRAHHTDEQSANTVICNLVVRCLQLRGEPLLDSLLSKNGMRPSTVDVLLNFLGKTNNHPMVECVGKHILDNIPTSVYLRKRLRHDKVDMSSCVTMGSLISKLLRTLEDAVAEKTSTDIVSVVVAQITFTMENYLRRDLEGMLRLIFDKLELIIKAEETKVSNSKTVDKMLAAFGGAWHRCLVTNATIGQDGLALMVAAIVNVIFRHPGKTTHLKVLGAIVGNALPCSEICTDERTRCRDAGVALLKECVQELNTCSAENESGFSGEGNDLLRRLSPLVCMRRAHRGYFQLAMDDIRSSSSSCDFLDVYITLARHLRNRFQNPMYTSAERRLAAEIAGQCLPFARCTRFPVFESFSSFHVLFQPEIERFHELCLTGSNGKSGVDLIRTTGVVLYMACHSMPQIGCNEDVGDAFFFAVSFALEVLDMDLDGDPSHPSGEDVVNFQTSCIEFLAACVDSSARNRIAKSTARSIPTVEVLVPKLDNVSTDQVMKCFDKIWKALMDIASGGFADQEWLCWSHKCLATGAHLPHLFSTTARICVWNAFIIASQRSTEEGGQLSLIAQTMMPWIVDWAVSENGRRANSLCVAAALQLAFTLITRTKSFDYWTKSDRHDRVRKVHMWALQSLQKNHSDSANSYTRGAERKAALKLMLAVVTIDQIDGAHLGACMAPGDIGETFAALRGVANMDRDSEVRQLAGHVLGTISNTMV